MITINVVTGVSGSGKTTYCNNQIDDYDPEERDQKPCIRIDNIYDYDRKKMDFEALYIWLSDNSNEEELWVDNYIFRADPEMHHFREICYKIFGAEYLLNLVFIIMDSVELHVAQVQKHDTVHPQYREETIHNEVVNRKCNMINLNSLYGWFVEYAQLGFNGILILIREIEKYTKVDSRVIWEILKDETLWFVDQVSGHPDYQPIVLCREVIREGISYSDNGWKYVKESGVDFGGKTVLDVGCFNFYFSFLAHKEKAKSVLGVDQNGGAINIASTLASMNQAWNCEFKQLDIGKETLQEEYDIVMALNMLHHVKKQGQLNYSHALDQIFLHARKEVIVEINEDQLDEISNKASFHGFSNESRHYTHQLSSYGFRWVVRYKK